MVCADVRNSFYHTNGETLFRCKIIHPVNTDATIKPKFTEKFTIYFKKINTSIFCNFSNKT